MQFQHVPAEAGVQWRNELEALYAKRTFITQQLEVLTAQRGQLADQVARTESGLSAAPKARLAGIDAQIAQLDQEAAKTNKSITELLSHAPPSQEHTPPPPPSNPVVEVIPDVPSVIHVPPVGWANSEVMRVVGLEAAGFVLLAAILCRWTWLRAKARFAPRVPVENSQLQQAVDAIAIEVERISEGQRFVTTLLNQRHIERKEQRPGVVSPIPSRMKEITPV